MFSELLSEIVYGLQRADKRVIYFESEENDSIDSLTDKILQYQIEGLILMYVNLTSELTESCRQRDIPVLQSLPQRMAQGRERAGASSRMACCPNS